MAWSAGSARPGKSYFFFLGGAFFTGALFTGAGHPVMFAFSDSNCSMNGSFVNDEKVQKHDLIDNDIIKLGDIEFEFKCRAMRERRE